MSNHAASAEPVTERSKRFGLHTPRDLLAKLFWELEHASDPTADVLVQGYRCFNAAITAWHLTDWVWKAFHQNEMSLQDFQHSMRKASKALSICDQLANGSKHFEKDKHNKTETFSVVEDAVSILRSSEGQFQMRIEPSIFVYDGPDKMGPFALFLEAHDFWLRYIDHMEQSRSSGGNITPVA